MTNYTLWEIEKMALDEDTKRQIEQNRQDALKRLEDRKIRLEIENSTNFNFKTLNLNPNSSVSSLIPTSKRPAEASEIATEPIARNIQRTIPSSFLKPLPSVKLAKTSDSHKFSESTELKTKSLSSNGIHPIVQLVSPSTFNITATSPVQAICRTIISQVTFNRADNTYTVPLSKYNFILEKLAASEKPQGHQLIPKTVLAAFDSGQVAQRNSAMSIDYRIESTIGSDLYNSLFPYQREGVKMAIARRGRLIIADEMGLGKTVQSVSFLDLIYNRFNVRGPFIVVAPLSTLPHWQREFAAWTDLRVLLYHGTEAARDVMFEYEFFYKDPKTDQIIPGLCKFDVILTTYEMTLSGQHHLRNIIWRVGIFDEAHRLKNKVSKAAEVLQTFQFEHKVLLTGTPIQNSLDELFALLNFLQPHRFFSMEHFLKEYGNLRRSEDVEKLQE